MNRNRLLSVLAMTAVAATGVIVGAAISSRQPRTALASPPTQTATPPPNDGKLRIIVFGAHPDDAEYRAAGVAMKWARAGHHVKLVSTTNGDIGHWESAGGPL